jgi:hypothetical protein
VAAQIAVYKLERFVCPILRLLGEGGTLMLGGDVDVTQLINVSQLRQPAHHAPPPYLLEGAEVDVPEPVMPPPGIITTASGEVDRPCDLQSQHIQLVTTAGNPCQQSALTIKNLQDTIFNVDLGPALVELPN